MTDVDNATGDQPGLSLFVIWITAFVAGALGAGAVAWISGGSPVADGVVVGLVISCLTVLVARGRRSRATAGDQPRQG